MQNLYLGLDRDLLLMKYVNDWALEKIPLHKQSNIQMILKYFCTLRCMDYKDYYFHIRQYQYIVQKDLVQIQIHN